MVVEGSSSSPSSSGRGAARSRKKGSRGPPQERGRGRGKENSPSSTFSATKPSDALHQYLAASNDEIQSPSTCSCAAIFAAQLIVYTMTLYPSIPGGDSGELVSVACQLGVAHPPGYPLFTMVWHFFIRYFSTFGMHFGQPPVFFADYVPVPSPALVSNFLSALCASGAGTCIFWAAHKLAPSCHIAAGTAAAALFSFSRLTWMYSVTAEVFALNNLFIGLLLVFLLRFIEKPSLARAAQGAFLAALSATNQHTTVLFLVVMVPWVLYHGRAFLLKPTAIAAMTAAAIAGALPYVYIPLSAITNVAEATWGDQRTLSGFLKHFLRQEYGTFDLGSRTTTTTTFAQRIQMHFSAFFEESFHVAPALLALFLLGWYLDRRCFARTSYIPIMGMFSFYEGFFNWRANLSIENKLLAGVHERFWMQPNMVLCLFCGLGLSYGFVALAHFLPGVLFPAREKRQQGAAKLGISQVASAFTALLILGAQVGLNYTSRDESANTAVYDLGKSVLRGLPQDSLLLTRGDLPGNAVRYAHLCENVRPDVRTMDLEMMTFDWFVPMLGDKFQGVRFPGTTYQFCPDCYQMKAFFDANYDSFPIFVFENLNEDDHTYQQHYETRHYGHAHRIVRVGQQFDTTEWLTNTTNALPKFAIPDSQKYDDRTWEAVVREGYVNSGVFLAMEFEKRGKAAGSRETALQELTAAFEVYTFWLDHVGRVMGYPFDPFWHKNFGIVANALYDLTHQKKHLEARNREWTAYVNSGVDDSQIPAIKSILAQK